jgi:hypothetical protein
VRAPSYYCEGAPDRVLNNLGPKAMATSSPTRTVWVRPRHRRTKLAPVFSTPPVAPLTPEQGGMISLIPVSYRVGSFTATGTWNSMLAGMIMPAMMCKSSL